MRTLVPFLMNFPTMGFSKVIQLLTNLCLELDAGIGVPAHVCKPLNCLLIDEAALLLSDP